MGVLGAGGGVFSKSRGAKRPWGAGVMQAGSAPLCVSLLLAVAAAITDGGTGTGTAKRETSVRIGLRSGQFSVFEA